MTNEKELIYVSGQIRKIMSEQGLTQVDMSRRINAGKNSVHQWTHGDCMPRGKALDSMISAFGLPEDYFEMPDGWQPPDDPEFYELKPPKKKKIKQAKSQSEAKEVRQAEVAMLLRISLVAHVIVEHVAELRIGIGGSHALFGDVTVSHKAIGLALPMLSEAAVAAHGETRWPERA